MMTEHVKRFLSMLVEALLGQAHRLARLAAVRHEVESYSLAYEEADSLEASGKPELARLLRAELEQTIGTALPAAPRRSGRWTWTAITALSHWSRPARRSLAPQPTSRRANRNGRIPRRHVGVGDRQGRRRTGRRQSRIPSRERRKPPRNNPNQE